MEKAQFIELMREQNIDSMVKNDWYNEFVEYLDNLDEQPDHYYRYCMTMKFILENLEIKKKQKVYETGYTSYIAEFFINKGCENLVSATDLRYRIDLDDNSVDLMLSLEVLEHIKDQAEKSVDDIVLFNYSGVKKYISEMYRVLKPGGHLVLTTPNPCSARNLQLLVNYESPYIFRGHVREYTKSEISELCGKFKELKYETNNCFFDLSVDYSDLFKKLDGETDHRGDDHFFIFTKE